MAGWWAVAAAGATARPQAPPSRCQRLWSLQRGRGRLTLGASGYGRDGGMWAPLPWRHRQQERQQGRGHLPPGASGSVAAGTTSGPAALYYAPAAAAMATTPPLPPPRLGDTPHAPPCPPMPPLPRARQLEPAPRRLVGGMAMDVCRPHQEERPAQGQITARALCICHNRRR
jgi:hypothetical protein